MILKRENQTHVREIPFQHLQDLYLKFKLMNLAIDTGYFLCTP